MRNTLNILKPGFHICQALRLVHSNSNLLPISLILIQRESHWTLQIEMHPSIANILFNHGYCFIVRTCFAKNNWLLWQCNFKENDTCSLLVPYHFKGSFLPSFISLNMVQTVRVICLVEEVCPFMSWWRVSFLLIC